MEQRLRARDFVPAYRKLLESGELERRAALARARLTDCDLCARYCHVNRLESIRGAVCRTGEQVHVSNYAAHFGEEDPLRGRNGSGTIFFAWCNLRCVFCQNYDISHGAIGRESMPSDLAAMMIELQREGCHNINFVSPSHAVAQIIQAVLEAAKRGLRVPLVYNTGGYDSHEALALLDGIVDIYMPDMKYGNSALGRKYSKVRDYVEVNQAAVREMHRQVDDLVLDEEGIALRGLLVRHLVLPNRVAGSDEVLTFIANEISRNTYVNIMDQYQPYFHACDYPDIARSVTGAEYQEALDAAARVGLTRLDHRVRRRRMRAL